MLQHQHGPPLCDAQQVERDRRRVEKHHFAQRRVPWRSAGDCGTTAVKNFFLTREKYIFEKERNIYIFSFYFRSKLHKPIIPPPLAHPSPPLPLIIPAPGPSSRPRDTSQRKHDLSLHDERANPTPHRVSEGGREAQCKMEEALQKPLVCALAHKASSVDSLVDQRARVPTSA